ncbi:formyl peptide receptor-related sequence 1-like [Ranitomeya variabilis]|uniref:formyl peptide receptor-related sequence 1-like n=1 Tax=Ranitomeya variabilis TaxID=490064 RepID=UPI0040574112
MDKERKEIHGTPFKLRGTTDLDAGSESHKSIHSSLEVDNCHFVMTQNGLMIADDNVTTSNITLVYNGWSSYDYDTLQYYRYLLQKISFTLLSIAFALGIISNGLVIWIAGFRMKKTISAVWFLNLAIADFLCCASIPLRIHQQSVARTHPSNEAQCIFNIFQFNLNMIASVLLLTAMSIDRLVSVLWPFWAKVQRTCKLVRITAAIIWGLSLVVACLLFYLFRYYLGDLFEWCPLGFITGLYSQVLNQTIQLIRFVIMCVIPFLIIFTTYVTIFYKLRKSKRSERSQRSSRIITAVILCFFMCWFPYYIWLLIPSDWYYLNHPLFYILHVIIVTLAFLNSCTNPIMYVFMGQDFQQGSFRSIPSRLEKALREPPNDLCREREDTGNTYTTDM